MKSKRMRKIVRENARFEKQTPYNFCDRWCERCPADTQKRCTLYMDELDCTLANIADQRDPHDLRYMQEKMHKKLEAIEGAIPPWEQEHNFSSCDDEIDTAAHDAMKEKRDTVQAHPLYKTTWQYMKKAHAFLKEVYYEKEDSVRDMKYDYDTVAWYPTLLSAKLYRALCDLYEPEEDEKEDAEMRFYSLCDAVAQFAICTKAINQSEGALKNIANDNRTLEPEIRTLLVILHNLSSRIRMIEEQI